jgi:hypothetical protein
MVPKQKPPQEIQRGGRVEKSVSQPKVNVKFGKLIQTTTPKLGFS